MTLSLVLLMATLMPHSSDCKGQAKQKIVPFSIIRIRPDTQVQKEQVVVPIFWLVSTPQQSVPDSMNNLYRGTCRSHCQTRGCK